MVLIMPERKDKVRRNVIDLPMWRRLVARVDAAVTPRADELVSSEAFAVAVGLSRQMQLEVQRRVERASRQTWHALNLPAGSDVNRLLGEIAALRRQVRDLDKRVGDADAA
jgi:hypothetical protein